MPIFSRDYKVRFEDCDYAGIVFFPRYVLMLHRFFEDWFAEEVGLTLGSMHEQRALGFPAVHLELLFKRPSRLDEVLTWSLQVEKLGRSSLQMQITASHKEEQRLTVRYGVVCTSVRSEQIKARRIPDDLREKIVQFSGD